MRKPFKVAAWAAVFLACAGVGAFVAAHTNPFPPGVDRPSQVATGTPTPSGSPVPRGQRWVGVVRTVARHDFYVGGACQTRWRTTVRFRVDGDTGKGPVDGAAVGHVVGRARCGFPQAQVQARTIHATLSGWYSTSSGTISVVFVKPTFTPEGSSDLGGYLTFLELPRVACQTVDGKVADASFDKQVSDGDRGTYRFVGSVSLRCLSGCQPPSGL